MNKKEFLALTPDEQFQALVLSEEKLAELTEKCNSFDKEVSELKEIIQDLNSKNSEAQDFSKGFGTVTVSKKTYNIVMAGCNFKGEVITAKDIKANSKLAAELVEEGCGILELKTKED